MDINHFDSTATVLRCASGTSQRYCAVILQYLGQACKACHYVVFLASCSQPASPVAEGNSTFIRTYRPFKVLLVFDYGPNDARLASQDLCDSF